MAKFYSGTIQKGSSGEDTKKWQEYLNTQGYGLNVDGDFGDNTYNATIDWQTKNGLNADGIVGEYSWGKAGYSNINNPITAPTSTPFEYAQYQASNSVKEAGNKKTDAENALSNYGDFSYSNQGSFDDIVNKILNREKFSYDLNGDALYQQYKDKYIQQGKMAMQDTMGQAAAMTGGYGNSYAASVGNQAYQAHLNNLNDVIPELYQMAYDKYNQEGQDLYNKYSMLSDDRNTQYGMWGDKRNQLVADRDYYTNNYNNERNFDYGKYADDKSYAYQTHRDSIEDAQWNAEFDEALRQHEQSMALTKEQWEWQKEQASKAASSGGSGGNGGSGGDGGEDDEYAFTYYDNKTTKDWKNLLPTQSEFSRNNDGYEYNGKKYKNWEEFIDAKISDALDNGDLTEDEAYSIMADLGLI